MTTYLQDLIEQAVARHPGKGKIVKIDEETQKRAWEAWKKGAESIAPLLDELVQERKRALARAKGFIVGSSLNLELV